NLKDEDEIVGTALTDGEQDIMLFSNIGKAIRFDENDVRVMERQAGGVRGMKLKEDMSVISMQVARKETLILTVTENGFGKCTPVDDYPTINRGGQGVISIKTSERNGNVVSSVAVTPDQEVVLITSKATLVRTRVAEISVVGRNTQGVKLINVGKGELVVGIAVVDVKEEDEFIEEVDGEETTTNESNESNSDTNELNLDSNEALNDKNE
ncbi:MAG TPA: DNA gyrase subunit A, partial [Thiomicrospira sp.]|nr:DNA gyrase subunit A [Thiomicrospira sp.]